MDEKKEIIKALDKCFEKKLSDGMVNWKNLFSVAPQLSSKKNAKSVWAKLVSSKHIKPYQVLWALKENPDSSKKEWLAVRVSLPRGTYYFNLRCDKDSKDFDLLSKKVNEDFGNAMPEIEEFPPF